MISALRGSTKSLQCEVPPGYQLLERCWDEQKVEVFLALCPNSDVPILIKASKRRRAQSRDVGDLRRDYETAKLLSFDEVVQPVRYLVHNGLEFLTLQDDGARPLAQLLGNRRLDLTTILEISVRAAETVDRLHATGFVHSQLNPYSLWCDPRSFRIKITDFSLAHKTDENLGPNRPFAQLIPDLRYISPEQTGRIRHRVDFRTDLYSLGVLLYEALTGVPPFVETNTLEMIHAHLARAPVPPFVVEPNTPKVVSDIVIKLLAKHADERYQSAQALGCDLAECLSQWRSKGEVRDFPIATSDVGAGFQISGALYGRNSEAALLQAAIDRAAAGSAELVLVSGPAGVGKSRLVRHVEPFLRAKGIFISAKFDQFRLAQPYSFVTQALRDLIHQTLAQNDDAIRYWKNRLLEALGPNGQIIIDSIPELELIIGPQPPVEDLPTAEKRNRFHRVFRGFVSAFLSQDRPLFIFLDDLQWADVASTELLKAVMTDRQPQYLLVLGAFRTGELDGSAELSRPIADLLATGVAACNIELTNFETDDVNHLLKDTLHCHENESRELAELLRQKTAGNPFFIRQFLSFLHRERLILFAAHNQRWEWDLHNVRARGVTDDVVKLLSGKLSSLPHGVQDALRTAACLGRDFDARRLALVNSRSEAEVLHSLRRAEREGLIIQADRFVAEAPTSESVFRFLHDKIQQACYSLTPLTQRAALQLRIGQALLVCVSPQDRDNVPFEIVDNLNEGIDLIESAEMRNEVARLNLLVGRRARESAAYEAALSYFQRGVALLMPNSWRSQYELARDLNLARFECAYVTGRMEEANGLFEGLLSHAVSRIDKAKVYYTRILLATGLEHSTKATDLGISALQLFGERLPREPSKSNLLHALLVTFIELRGRRAKDLVSLPEMTDPNQKSVAELLMSICPAAYFTNPSLMALAALRITRLSLRYGNTSASSFGYVLFGLVCAGGLGRYKLGHDFGRLAVELATSKGSMIQRCKILLIFAGFINFWRSPIDTSIEMLFASLKLGLDTGDIQYANYSMLQLVFLHLARGSSLDDVRNRCEEYRSLAAQTKDAFAIANIDLRIQFILALQDSDRIGSNLDRDGFDETEAVNSFFKLGNLTTVFYYRTLKYQLMYLMGEFESVFANANVAEANVEAAPGQIVVAEYYFYRALAAAGLMRRGARKKSLPWRFVNRARSRFRTWAFNCPENFRQHYELLTAEFAALKGDFRKAEVWYDKAIQSSREVRFTHVEAIANELAGNIYLEQNRMQIAQAYLKAAKRAYTQWGAKAKVALLERSHPEIFAELGLQAGGSPSRWAVDRRDSGLAGLRHVSSRICRNLERILRRSSCRAPNAADLTMRGRSTRRSDHARPWRILRSRDRHRGRRRSASDIRTKAK